VLSVVSALTDIVLVVAVLQSVITPNPAGRLVPRCTVPLAVLPVLVSAARIAVNDHDLSDVIASAAVAALVALAYAVAILERSRTQCVLWH